MQFLLYIDIANRVFKPVGSVLLSKVNSRFTEIGLAGTASTIA